MKIGRKNIAIIRHGVTLPVTLLMTWLFVKYQYFDFHNIGAFWRIAIMTFFSFFAAGVNEWQQGVRGANRTPIEQKDMENDIIISTLSGLIGVLVTELFII